MDLDLERFWAVVRPKRHKPAPKPKSLRLYLEGVESIHGPRCTNISNVTLPKVGDEYHSEVRFAALAQEVTITGFRVFTKPNEQLAAFIECSPRHLSPGDSAILDLHISENGEVMRQLMSRIQQ